MRELILTTRFRRDLRRAARRGKNEEKLREVIERLVAGEPLEPRHRVRALEEFMEVPFPRATVAVGIIEPSLQAGEKPERGVGYSLLVWCIRSSPHYSDAF